MLLPSLLGENAIAEKEDNVHPDENPHGKVSCVKNAVTELRLAEYSSLSAPVAQDGFRDAENDDDADDKGYDGVIHVSHV